MRSTPDQLHELIIRQAAEWFAAHRAGQLSEAQRQLFIRWLNESPVNTAEYLALTAFADDLASAASNVTMSAEQLIEDALREQDVAVLELGSIPSGAGLQSADACDRAGFFAAALRRWALPVLAVAVLVVAGLTRTALPWQQSTYSTAHAEQRSWRLPDGSTVHLNSGSKIAVSFDDDRRDVELIRGQAVFHVAKDPLRVFRVRAGAIEATALGTQFDVYRHEQTTLISVIEGRVRVTPGAGARAVPQSASSAPVEIVAGEQVRVGADRTVVSKEPEDVRKTVAWLQRQVIFDHDPLGEVVEQFNRYNEIQIRVLDAGLRSERISGNFSAYDMESFTRFLERQPELHVERVDGAIVVTRSGQPR